MRPPRTGRSFLCLGACEANGRKAMVKNGPCPDYDAVFSARVSRVGLDAARLSPANTELFAEIRNACPGCDDPARCAAALATPAGQWEDWDEYCPNARRLRVLAALTMFAKTDVSGG